MKKLFRGWITTVAGLWNVLPAATFAGQKKKSLLTFRRQQALLRREYDYHFIASDPITLLYGGQPC